MAYHDNNKRELELTRHVSLRQLDPLALLTLEVDRLVPVTIPEWLFDRDCPGHYMRRIKSRRALDPFRRRALHQRQLHAVVAEEQRAHVAAADRRRLRAPGPDDDRFVDYFGAGSRSSPAAANDSGLFETNLRDERFLPVRGRRARKAPGSSTCPRSSAVRLRHDLRRDPAPPLYRAPGRRAAARAAVANLKNLVADANATGLGFLLSLRHEFPSEWSAFANGIGDFTATLSKDHFRTSHRTRPSASPAASSTGWQAPAHRNTASSAIRAHGMRRPAR